MKPSNTKTVLMLAAAVLCGSGTLFADDDHHHERKGDGRGFLERWFGEPEPSGTPAAQHFYVEGCGGCHFPYQPGFLPARSWEKIMNGLEDHFGENAELADEEAARIRDFLLTNAAGQVNSGLSNKMMSTLGKDPAPLRITETRFFRHEHDEIPLRMVKGNSNIGSFSNCDACHTQALQGSFDERQVRIPGYGRWEDD